MAKTVKLSNDVTINGINYLKDTVFMVSDELAADLIAQGNAKLVESKEPKK